MGDPPAQDAWLTVREAAAFVGVSPSTLRRWADAGLVPVNRTPTHHRRFRAVDLGRFRKIENAEPASDTAAGVDDDPEPETSARRGAA